MKKIFILLMISMTAFGFSVAEAQNEEMHYLGISNSLDKLNTERWKYLKSVIRDKSNQRINKTKISLMDAFREQATAVKQIPSGRDQDTSLKHAVLQYYKLKLAYLGEDYESIMNVDTIVAQSLNYIDAWVRCRRIALDSLIKAENHLKQVLKDFPQKHNIIVSPEVDEKLKNKVEFAASANTYYSKMNLVFLDVFIQHSSLFDAIKRSEVSSIIQNRNAVLQVSDVAAQKLETFPAYRGDESLKKTAMNIIQLYRAESEEEISAVIDYFIQQDNLDRLQKIMDAKNVRESTEKDQLRFQEAKEAYEASAEKCATAIYKMGSNQNRMLELWEKTGEEFFRKHTL